MNKLSILDSFHDSLAQLAEHLTFNQGVRGSNPRWVTKNRAIPFGMALFSRFVQRCGTHRGHFFRKEA